MIFIRRAALKTIKLYQLLISPHLRPACRFYPSCSEYCSQTIQKYGAVKGIVLGLKRILKCHPGQTGGVDLP